MDKHSKLQALSTLLLAVGAIIVTFWPPTNVRWRLLIVFLFVAVAIVGAWLQKQKEDSAESHVEHAQAELLNWQRGDSERPPYVIFEILVDGVSSESKVQFLLRNSSDFPAYDIGVRLWDTDVFPTEKISLEKIIERSIVNELISSIAPHTEQDLGRIDLPSDINVKKFGASFTTRTGSFSENLNGQKTHGTWVFATRVTHTDGPSGVVFQQVDSLYPLNSKGEVDW
jgi:hypothetical protein